MHLLKSVHTSSPLNTIAERNEARYFSLSPPPLATAPAQNVLPRLNLIITAANTMAPNSTSRFFEGCRLHRHHNPLHLAHSLTDRQRGQNKMEREGRKEGGRGRMKEESLSPLWYFRLLITVHLLLPSFGFFPFFFIFISYSI